MTTGARLALPSASDGASRIAAAIYRRCRMRSAYGVVAPAIGEPHSKAVSAKASHRCTSASPRVCRSLPTTAPARQSRQLTWRVTRCSERRCKSAHRFACPALSSKIFPFSFDPNHRLIPRHPVPGEGRWPSSRTLGWDAVDAAASSRAGLQGGPFGVCEHLPGAWTNGAVSHFR
jgi:hypothetical protein